MTSEDIRKQIEVIEMMGQAAAGNVQQRLDWLQAQASWEIALQLSELNENGSLPRPKPQ